MVFARLVTLRCLKLCRSTGHKWKLATIPLASLSIASPSPSNLTHHSVVFYHDEEKSWILQAIESLKIVLRSIQMAILTAPLVLTAPFAMYIPKYQEFWLRLLVITIQLCGPVFIKLGQWASTRRDLFPSALCNHLSQLQRNASVHGWVYTEEILRRNKLDQVFEQFDTRPIGSGCCAQVYQAELKGRPVAVKVLHPDIKSHFLRDLTVLRSLIGGVSWLFPQLQWLSIKESVEEFAHLMNVQVDLRNEMKNLVQFRDNFQNDSTVNFPQPIEDLCCEEVLVESLEKGQHIGNIVQNLQSVSQSRRKAIASKGVQMFLKMVFSHNFVHCDLHPGNILVDDDKLIILDPGLTASLSPKDMRNFRAVFTAVVKGDGRTVGEEILQQSEQRCVDPPRFIAEIEEIVVNARSKLSLSKIDVSDLLTRVFNVLRHHQVKLEPNFTSVIISIMVLEGLGRTLDPDMDLLWAAAPFLLT